MGAVTCARRRLAEPPGARVDRGGPRGAGRGRGTTALRWSAAVLGIAAIGASVSWGAYVDLAVVLAVAAGFRAVRRGFGRPFALGLAACLVLLALGLATPPGRRVLGAVAERLALLKSTAAGDTASGADTPEVRLRNADHAWSLFVERPAKGIGLGQFGRYAWKAGSQRPALNGETQSFADSLARRDPWLGWLTIATEAGVAGPLVLALAIGIAAFRARGPAAGVVSALAALAVVQQIHTASFIDLWWWYPLALAVVIGWQSERVPAAAEIRP